MAELSDTRSDPLIHAPLLDKLLHQPPGQRLTVHTLAQMTGLSLDHCHDELARLSTADCELDHHPGQGVTLTRTGCAAWTDYLQWLLGPHRPVVVYRQTASTQDAARRLLGRHGPASHGAAVIADHQYAGRGRLGRTWLAPPGGAVTMSVIHVAPVGQERQSLSVDRLIFATAVAVAQGIEAASPGLRTHIKWPNDVLIEGLKVAGILVETLTLTGQRAAAIIGVGINVAGTPDLADVDTHRPMRKATSLADHGPPVDRLHVMGQVLLAIDRALSMEDPSPLVEHWRDRSVLLAQAVRFQTPQGEVQGHVIDLDAAEGLIVRTDSGAILHLPAATTSVM